MKGLARHGVTWKTRQQKQEEVAPAGVNPMSTCPSSFIPKALACLLLFLPPLAVLHGKHFSSPLPTAETLKTSSLSFVLEVKHTPILRFSCDFVLPHSHTFPIPFKKDRGLMGENV